MQHLLYEEGVGFFLTLIRTDNLTTISLESLEMQCVAKTEDYLNEDTTFGKRSD